MKDRTEVFDTHRESAKRTRFARKDNNTLDTGHRTEEFIVRIATDR